MAGHQTAGPDLGVLAAGVLSAVERELFAMLAEHGFDDIRPRMGAVLAHLCRDGIRASELARESGQHKQVIGTLIDELARLGYVERKPDPADRRAKPVYPTERGLRQMETAVTRRTVFDACATLAVRERGGGGSVCSRRAKPSSVSTSRR